MHTLPTREPDFTHKEYEGWHCEDHSVMHRMLPCNNEIIVPWIGADVDLAYSQGERLFMKHKSECIECTNETPRETERNRKE